MEEDLKTAVTKFVEESDYTDGFLIETDIDEETVGYYTSKYDYPVCNHRNGVTDKNIGYAKGITASGVPFESELFEKSGTLMMAIVFPAIFNEFYEGEEDDTSADEHIMAMCGEKEFFDYSVLDVGMLEGTIEKNTHAIRDYVDFLVNNGIVTFTTDLINGIVLYRVDKLGNDLAKVLITMQKDKKIWAYTDIDFADFPSL